MIKIGDIELTKEQQEIIISALYKYDESLKTSTISPELLKEKIKTLKDIGDILFNERKKLKKPYQNVYTRFGAKYRKLERHETIKNGAMHSWCNGELEPIISNETIGQTPADFSDERDFYNPIVKTSTEIQHHPV